MFFFVQTLLQTFKNSLIYTACATQVTIFLDENAGGSRASLILMTSFSFVAIIFQTLKAEIIKLDIGQRPGWVEWRDAIDSLKGVSTFTLDILSNLATQMVSSMTAATVSDAVRGGDSSLWSLLGALICIILLWLLTLIVNNHKSRG